MTPETFETARGFYVACHPKRRRPGKSFQGFQQAVKKLPMPVLRTLAAEVRGRIERLFGDRLLVLDPSATAATQLVEDAPQAQIASGAGLSFRAPSSGRFYVRPAPDKAAFVEAGDPWHPATSKKFIEIILSTGDAIDRNEAYKKFRGREPKVDALMKNRGFN